MTYHRKTLKTGIVLAAIGTLFLAMPAAAQITHVGDVEIDGSLCVGFDCTGSTSFGFDTIVMRENNLRLLFQDTSTSASFPTTDWRLIANDSANGGDNKFSVEDVTGSRVPFTIRAGARSNSLVIDAQGEVGLGTLNAAVDLHVVDGDTATLRLQQDGTSGFAPYTWDVAGNETNFFIRDTTGGSTLPLRIRPGTPSNAVYIDTDGVAINRTNPDARFHISSTDTASNTDDGVLLVENTSSTTSERDIAVFRNNGDVEIHMTNSAGGAATPVWKFGNNQGDFRILTPTTPGQEFSLSNTGALTIAGSITTGGTMCGSGCDAVFEPDYDLPSIEEHAEMMWTQKHLPNVGPTVEGAPIDLTDKVGRMLNELEKAHIYIDQLDKQNKILEARLAKLEKDALQ